MKMIPWTVQVLFLFIVKLVISGNDILNLSNMSFAEAVSSFGPNSSDEVGGNNWTLEETMNGNGNFNDSFISFTTHCRFCLPPLEGGEDLYVSMAGWTNIVCGESVCNDTLDNRDCGPLFCENCYCDDYCLRYGDCCPDKLQSLPTPPTDAHVGCFPQSFISSKQIAKTRYKMVGRCPKSSDSLTSRLCEEPDSMDLQNNIPVYSKHTQLHYRNIHCAICHQATDRIQWDVQPLCKEYVDFSKAVSRNDIVDMIRQEESCAIHFKPPITAEVVRYCPYTGFGIDTCNVTGLWMTHDNNVEKACGMMYQSVWINEKLYKNIFCASCNGENLELGETCYFPIARDDIVPFSILLDVRLDHYPATYHTELYEPGEMCPDTQVFDTLKGQCRDLFCAEGKIPVNHNCESEMKTSENLGYIVHFKINPRNQDMLAVSNVNSMVYHIQRLVRESESLFTPRYAALSVNVTFNRSDTADSILVYSMDIQYGVLIGSRIPTEVVESRLLRILTKEYWWVEPPSVSPVYFNVKWLPDLNPDRLSGTNSFFMSPISLESPELGTFFFKTVEHSFVPSHFYENVSSYIQVSHIMFCNRIELNRTEFTSKDSETVILNHKNQMLKEGEFLWNEDRIQVCTNFTGQKKSPDNITDFSTPVYDQTEVMLTLICTSLSLCGLAITLLIYLVIPTLRTLPGRNNMFLFSNLFLAQLLFLTGSAAKVSLPACRALGVIIHYFWLSTFCWKLICAFHMYRLFTNPLKTLDQTKTLIRYIIFGQLTPFVVIGLVILINAIVSGMSKIGYAERPNLCFLSGTLDVALSFVTPVVLVVLLNIFFFSRVVYELRSRPKIQRNTSKSDAKEFVLYFKMSLILGFTWIVGFIALIVNNPGLWYVFTVINASVGVFVLIAFGLKNVSSLLFAKGRFDKSDQHTTTTSNTYETKCPSDHVDC